MKKSIFLALMLAFVGNVVFAQATKAKDGSWTLNNVKLSAPDQENLVKLLEGNNYSLVQQEGASTKTYGKASLSNLRPTASNGGQDLAKTGNNNVNCKNFCNIFSALQNQDVQKKVDAILVKYSGTKN